MTRGRPPGRTVASQYVRPCSGFSRRCLAPAHRVAFAPSVSGCSETGVRSVISSSFRRVGPEHLVKCLSKFDGMLRIPTMTAGEGHRLGPQPLGQRERRVVGQLTD